MYDNISDQKVLYTFLWNCLLYRRENDNLEQYSTVIINERTSEWMNKWVRKLNELDE